MNISRILFPKLMWVITVLCVLDNSITEAFIFGHRPNVCPEEVKITLSCYRDCDWTPECVKAERIPNPNDCGKYADCIPNGTSGEFIVVNGDCKGFPFSPTLLQCVSQDEYPECESKVRPGGNVRLTYLDHLCVQNNTNFCYNCQQSVTCIGDQAYGEFCNMESFCSQLESYGGSVCLPYQPGRNLTTECQCQPDKTSDSYNKNFYLTCQEEANNTFLEVHSCPSGQEFNETLHRCNDKDDFCDKEPPVPDCSGKNGTFFNPLDCSWAYTCSGNAQPEKTSCCGYPSVFFNEIDQECVQACYVISPEKYFICPKVGLIPDPLDCRGYYTCINVGDTPLKHEICPNGTYFDGIVMSCIIGECPPKIDYMNCPRADEIITTC